MIAHLAGFSFGQPWWLLLLVLLPLTAWMRGGAAVAESVPYSAVQLLRRISTPIRKGPGRWRRHASLATVALCVLAMARPRLDAGAAPDARNGVDIVFCVDVSGSMDARDFPAASGMISKREANIQAINDLVDHRPNDRFGMIGFAGDTYILSPLTIDGDWIKGVLREIRLQAWTAIGEGIVSSVELLKHSPAKARMIIVTSDGANNYGISPLEAAELAARENIRVYTVQFLNPRQVSAANAKSLMSRIASTTGGMYFQASSLENIISIYREIDRLEKTRFPQKQSRLYDELFPWFVLAAFLAVAGGWVGGNTLWSRVP